MHVLVTADTVGGVWTYTRELVSGLVHRGHKITLVSFGKLPSCDQTRWLSGVPGIDFHPTSYRLEWMQDAACDVTESIDYLYALVRESNPDLLHLSQFVYGALPVDLPRVIVAHSDVLSWWRCVHGEAPPDDEWLGWYRDVVSKGLRGASAVVAPSRCMLRDLKANFKIAADTTVIHNGRNPRLFRRNEAKKNQVVAVGRIWDQAKQLDLLSHSKHKIPVTLVGPNEIGAEQKRAHLASSQTNCDCTVGIECLGTLNEPELCNLLAESSIYAATACYEPFGLAPLEAALSGCALVANDIPTFHEIWGDAALYFRRNDHQNLAECIDLLANNPELRQNYADRAYERSVQRYTTDHVVDQYEALYQRVVAGGVCA